MRRVILLCLHVSLFSATISTEFLPQSDAGEDIYGSKLFKREVNIDVQNLEVKNHFGSYVNNSQDTISKIGRKGTFLITVSSNSLCVQDKALEESGCSGQKPFLINTPTANLFDDNLTHELAFDKAQNYDSNKNNTFYALDVARDEKYYQASEEVETPSKKSFFAAIKEMFSNYFSSEVVYYGDGIIDDEIRDRYMANIISGIDQNHLLTKPSANKEATVINAELNRPVSLLDYESQMSTVKNSCDPSHLICKMINGFHMADWMPFFSSGVTISTETSSVMIDTENALLTAVGELNGVNIFSQMQSDLEGSTSFFGELFKPVTFMFETMMSFFFGEDSSKTAAVVANHYDFTKYNKILTLTVPVTSDGASVSDFASFDLVGLDSVYGTEVTKCVIDDPSMFAADITLLGSSTNSDIDLKIEGLYLMSSEATLESIYSQLDFHTSFFKKYFDTTKDDLLSWCARREEYESKGIIGRMKILFENILASYNGDKESQIDDLMAKAMYSVKSYEEKNHRGLILHLQKTELSPENITNDIKIKLIKSENR